MTYLQIVKQVEAHDAMQMDHASSLCNEIDERDESSTVIREDDSSISSNSFGRDVISKAPSADAAIGTLRFWYGIGLLDTLPERIPGFVDELAHYSDRARLIGVVKAILDSVQWSLTAQERAVQFVGVLTPLIDGRAV